MWGAEGIGGTKVCVLTTVVVGGWVAVVAGDFLRVHNKRVKAFDTKNSTIVNIWLERGDHLSHLAYHGVDCAAAWALMCALASANEILSMSCNVLFRSLTSRFNVSVSRSTRAESLMVTGWPAQASSVLV